MIDISTVSEAGLKFRENPNEKTFAAALKANLPRHFPLKSRASGEKMFKQLPFNFKAMLWWFEKAIEINFDAKWIPQKVPTLILGGKQDFVVPCHIFENDKRFKRNNIKIKTLRDAGHFLWLDDMAFVKSVFNSFFDKIISENNET